MTHKHLRKIYSHNARFARQVADGEPKMPPTVADDTFGNRLSLPLRIVATSFTLC